MNVSGLGWVLCEILYSYLFSFEYEGLGGQLDAHIMSGVV